MGHPDAFSVRHYAAGGVEPSREALAGESAAAPAGKLRACLVCRKPLDVGDRRVHRGACQRARKTQLQRLTRWRRRR